MKDWFADLEPREQLFVGVGAIVVVLTILWGLIWTPLNNSHNELRASVDNWDRSLRELQPLKAVVESSGGISTTQVTDAQQTPVVVVDQTLRARGLNSALKRRQPTPNGIRVEFENVAFDDLVLWLGDLSNRYAMNVQAGSLSVASRAGPGRINASLTLERTL